MLLVASGVAAGLASWGLADSPMAPQHTNRDCGHFVAHQGAADGITHDGWICFTTAMRSGQAAHITLQRPSSEGDPVLTTYTTAGDGTATVITDSRADRFAGNGTRVQREICTKPDTRPVAQAVLVFLDCSTPEPLPPGAISPSP